MSADFGQRLQQTISANRSVLCVGIDPHPSMMPALFGGTEQHIGDADSLQHLKRFCSALIQASAGSVAAIKPQVAFFEAYGPKGFEILQELSAQARNAGLLVIMDAKRGDIGSTAKAYASAWLGAGSAYQADALTINPYLGRDSLTPFYDQALATQSGLFILTRTSNPGSADIQQLAADNMLVWEHVADMLSTDIHSAKQPDTLLSPIGIVAGATGPDEAGRLRELLPSAPFLIPGYGAQGATAHEATAGLITDASGVLTGGVVNASRAISHNREALDAPDEERYIEAVRTAIEHANADLNTSGSA